MPASSLTREGGAGAAGVVLEIRGLAVSFPAAAGTKHVLSDLDLAVLRGEFVCIVGPSGTGKTTLIRCMCGLLAPTAGRVAMDGEPYTSTPAGLALVSQDYSRSLMPWLRVEDNVRLPLRGKGIPRAEIDERVTEALAAVGLVGARRSYPWQLSGGMQQRVSLARALAYRPEVLIMDEPFASVDAQTRSELEDLILRLQRETGITVVLITHDIDESVYLADRVVVLGGAPASVTNTIEVRLGRDRDQLRTKALPEFLAHRAEVFESIAAARAAVAR
ncbi:MAG: ABC transporter ATP-binding protein [Leifsonia sp.]|uniref:ABC transporter ATP-binding protein n=1 Tax=Leifsonia sp. TaxID=1870902 RepID=UPI003F7E2C8C